MLPYIAVVPEPLLIVLTVTLLAVLAVTAAAVATRRRERTARRLDPAPYVPALLVREDDRVVTGAGVVTVIRREPLTGDGYVTVTLEAADGRRSRHDWPTDSTVRVLTPPHLTRARGRGVLRPLT